jgi:PAS domain S-box-containing protein
MTLGFALLEIAYLLLLYKREYNKSSALQATLYLYLLQILTVISLIHTTGQFHSIYMIAWAILVLVSGIFGLYAIIGISFIASLYFILTAVLSDGSFKLDTYSLIGLFITYVLAIMSYVFFRKLYNKENSSQISKLSGALKNKQIQSEILMQSIADGIIVTDTDGKISLINPAASAMLEWPVDEASGIDVQTVVKLSQDNGTPVTQETNPFFAVISQKQAIGSTYQLQGRNGKTHIVSFIVSPILIPGSEQLAGTVAVMRDVSAAKAEEQRRADFISTASHEMRTPVAAIEGYLALALNDRVSKIDSKARDYLEKAHSSTQHLGQLFQDLLTSAKAEDGRLVSHPVVVEMGTYLEQITDTLRFTAEKKGLLVEFIIGTSDSANDASSTRVVKPLYYTHADPDRLREVITNLFDNAVKYTEKGKISIGLTGNNDVVQFYIRDSGAGIPKEDIPHLFQKFYRVDNSTTRTIGGTGLGLFICKKIVELYRGRIWVESEPEVGSTFYINLPRLNSQKARELQTQEASQSPLSSTPLAKQ